MIPAATMKLGVAVISLKKHMTRPMIPNAITAIVPLPMPSTNPSYISVFPVSKSSVVEEVVVVLVTVVVES